MHGRMDCIVRLYNNLRVIENIQDTSLHFYQVREMINLINKSINVNQNKKKEKYVIISN